ncbi:glycosyltransferase [Candidatus Microgenomates bacterium]|nr:MAG: glycosyltransferase [Candidatus Microgenomates bacterium]
MTAFIPHTVDRKMVVLMPPTIDYLDGLSKSLSTNQKVYYMQQFNKLLIESGQTPLDLHRPYIIQVARFDPAKGIPDVIESYYLLRKQLKKMGKTVAPQLVIAGNASIDDPDGVPLYNLTRDTIRQKKYADICDDIKIARLPPNDQLLNTITREGTVALQLSHKEGFEFKVTEALKFGLPLISYKAGGIPLQMVNGVTGYVVPKIGDTQSVAKHLFDLFTNDKLYQRMSRGAIEHSRKDISTVNNAVHWLWLALTVLQKGKLKTNTAHIYDLLPEA